MRKCCIAWESRLQGRDLDAAEMRGPDTRYLCCSASGRRAVVLSAAICAIRLALSHPNGQRSPGRRRWVGRSRTVFCQLLLLMVKQGASISRPSPHVPSQSGHQPRHHTRGHTSDLQRQAGGRLSNVKHPYSQYIWRTMESSRGLVRWGGDPGPAPPRATGCVPRSRVSGQVFRATSANNDDILATACTICTAQVATCAVNTASGQLDIGYLISIQT